MPQLAARNHSGDGDIQHTERNHLLRCMPRAEYDLLRPLLTTVPLEQRQTLFERNEPIVHVYFPETCALSLMAEAQEGGPVEVGAVGNEGFVGVPVLLDAQSTPYRAMVQIAGEAKRIPAAAFRALTEDRPLLRRFLAHYPLYLLHQLAQSVACARLHPLSERCARWLLVAHDRVLSDTFPLTQEFLAEMLAVHRPGVSVAAEMLQEDGLIRYSRGKITILDRDGLEAAACSCYRITRDAYAQLFPDADVCPPPDDGALNPRAPAPHSVS